MTGEELEFSAEEIDEIELEREIASRSLLGFIQVGWDQVERSPLIVNWHNEAICEFLEAMSRGEIRDGVINVPPGSTKSLSCAVFWTPWEWNEVDPALRYIFATYSDSLSKRDALRTKNLVDSPWFQARWPQTNFPHTASRSMQRLETQAGGVRFSTSIGGGVTGRHAHRIVVDDPIKPMDTIGTRAVLGTKLDLVSSYWDQTISTRQADPKRTTKLVVMQRLHTNDLAQKVLDETDGVHHLNLPMEYEAKAHCYIKIDREDGTSLVIEDPRTEEGELLNPKRFGPEEVKKLKKALGSLGSAAQLQQRPTPAGGATFKDVWFQYWGVAGCAHVALPPRGRYVQIWDMSFKGKPGKGQSQKRSFVCGQVWYQLGADLFLLDQERGQWGFVEQQKALIRLTGRWPRCFRKYVEDAANGPAIVKSMAKRVPGLKLVGTGGGSEARAEVASITFESGNVYFPHKSLHPWVEELEQELLGFPMGRWDDQVDCVSHAVTILAESVQESYKKAMDEVMKGGMVA